MTQQAKNSMKLYKGNNPTKIKQLLILQNSSVVDELKKEFGTNNLEELSIKLSIGKLMN